MNGNYYSNPAALGYFGVVAATWMISMIFAGWFGKTIPLAGYLISLIIGGILPFIVGIMLFFKGKTMDMLILIIFSSLAGFIGMYGLTIEESLMEVSSAYDGWANLIFAVFFFSLWMANFGRDTARSLLLIGLSLVSLSHTIGHWTSSMIVFLISGYLGLITSLLAGNVAIREIFDAVKDTEKL